MYLKDRTQMLCKWVHMVSSFAPPCHRPRFMRYFLLVPFVKNYVANVSCYIIWNRVKKFIHERKTIRFPQTSCWILRKTLHYVKTHEGIWYNPFQYQNDGERKSVALENEELYDLHSLHHFGRSKTPNKYLNGYGLNSFFDMPNSLLF